MKMTVHDIARKLIGQIKPVGETNTDELRFDNLKETCELTLYLIEEIQEVSKIESHEYSVKRSADYAKEFIKDFIKDTNVHE